MASFTGLWSKSAAAAVSLPKSAAALRKHPIDREQAQTGSGGCAGIAGRFRGDADQPGLTPDGSVRAWFDGELFNKTDVRKFVVSRGVTLKTDSVAELLAHLWVHKGRDLMMSLRGAFAIAVWDEKNDTFFLARDAMGHRPLYTYEGPDGFAFSSELPPLVALQPGGPALETRALGHYLAFHIAPAPLTLFRDLRKLQPAHWLEIQGGNVQGGRYWTPSYYDTSGQNPEEIAQHAFSYLFESVKAHTRDLDTPLVYLEGDPFSAVLAGLANLAKRGKNIRTFSLRHKWVPEEARDGANASARRFGSDHREEEISDTIAKLLDGIVTANVEALPISRMAPALLFAHSAGAAEKGVLTAAGGELYQLAGQRPIAQAVSTIGLWRRLRESVEGGAKPPSKEVASEFEARMIFSPLERLRINRHAGVPAMETIADTLKQSPVPSDAMTAAYADAVLFLPDLFLGPVEATCRMMGLPVRAPLADPSAVQLLVPVLHNLAETRPMQGLRRIFENLVPEDAFWETRWATATDWEHAAARELCNQACETLSEPKSNRGIVDASVVKGLVDSHRRHETENDRKILLLYALELWHRKYIERH